MVTVQSAKNVELCLSNQISFKPTWSKTYLQSNHNERDEEEHEISQSAFVEGKFFLYRPRRVYRIGNPTNSRSSVG